MNPSWKSFDAARESMAIASSRSHGSKYCVFVAIFAMCYASNIGLRDSETNIQKLLQEKAENA